MKTVKEHLDWLEKNWERGWKFRVLPQGIILSPAFQSMGLEANALLQFFWKFVYFETGSDVPKNNGFIVMEDSFVEACGFTSDQVRRGKEQILDRGFFKLTDAEEYIYKLSDKWRAYKL
jgi:hypothetical protein